MKADGWALQKIGPKEIKTDRYEFHSRACDVYTHWMSGFTEEEICNFFELELATVKRDLQYMQSTIPVSTQIKHNNDRLRILAQREQSEDFRRLMKDALSKTASDYIAAGLNPAGILKEFRESIGMTTKPEPTVQFNTQQNFFSKDKPGNATGFSSAEDIVRHVLDAQSREDPIIIDAEAIEIHNEEPSAEGEDSVPAEE